MEYEVRFYYSISEYNNKIFCLEKIESLKNNGRKYEKTSQFNHPSSDSNCKLSWKRRLSKFLTPHFFAV